MTISRSIRVEARGSYANGRITHLTHGRLCGLIRAKDGLSIFFHGRDLSGVRYNDLEVGCGVTFELIDDPISGPRAVQIHVIAL